MKLGYYSEKNQIEKFIGVLLLGVFSALEHEVISIDESTCFIFRPYIVRLLTELGCNQELVEIIEEGCELEDIESLIPDQLLAVVEELKGRLITILKQEQMIFSNFDVELKS